jgi:peroxiredoxin
MKVTRSKESEVSAENIYKPKLVVDRRLYISDVPVAITPTCNFVTLLKLKILYVQIFRTANSLCTYDKLFTGKKNYIQRNRSGILMLYLFNIHIQ